ncbi:hypothetical protein PK28_03115 [Hymenobacter sp. DG25B]|uniref:hypothetical protein n=1 Tax=Hymenobacter sp. DG25B TaxID=1385664 RepID=UPI000540F1C1|nr:hypothetical protein [Hymenobacter sp. DG25B]AIZ62925.1 hypothetical protein PK28_03115 [Hymenobacter sp. DG25B]
MKAVLYLFLAAAGLTLGSCEKDEEVSPTDLTGLVSNSTWHLTDYTVEAKAVNSNSSEVHSIFIPCYGLDQYTLAADGRILWTQLEGTCTHYWPDGPPEQPESHQKNLEIGAWILKENNTKLQIKSTWGWVYHEVGSDYETSQLDASHLVINRQYLSSQKDTLYTRKSIFTKVN